MVVASESQPKVDGNFKVKVQVKVRGKVHKSAEHYTVYHDAAKRVQVHKSKLSKNTMSGVTRV